LFTKTRKSNQAIIQLEQFLLQYDWGQDLLETIVTLHAVNAYGTTNITPTQPLPFPVAVVLRQIVRGCELPNLTHP